MHTPSKMSANAFPPIGFANALEPWGHPQRVPTAPNSVADIGAAQPLTPTTVIPSRADGDAIPVRDPYHFASLTSLTTTPSATLSAKFLDQPTNKRNMLLLRNASTSANVYVEFGKDATVNSTLKLSAGAILLFDVVVPQDDLFAIADATGAVLAYSYSTIA